MLELVLAALKGEYFHSVNISGFIDFGWTVKLVDHEGEEYIAYHKELTYAILDALHKWMERIEIDEFDLNPHGDKTD